MQAIIVANNNFTMEGQTVDLFTYDIDGNVVGHWQTIMDVPTASVDPVPYISMPIGGSLTQ
jgi:hypothetical protein